MQVASVEHCLLHATCGVEVGVVVGVAVGVLVAPRVKFKLHMLGSGVVVGVPVGLLVGEPVGVVDGDVVGLPVGVAQFCGSTTYPISLPLQVKSSCHVKHTAPKPFVNVSFG